MLVTRQKFSEVLEALMAEPKLSLDTETTGLRPYHGSRLFSIAIGSPSGQFYFNFMPYEGVDPEQVLTPFHMAGLSNLFVQASKTWFLHNAKFDLHMLAQEGLFLNGTLHDTQALALIEFNEHLRYSLDACAERIGYSKSDAVEEYIKEHDLWEWETIPGKKARKKNKFYWKVPLEVVQPYAERDAEVTLKLGLHQEARLAEMAKETAHAPNLPTVLDVAANERRLTRTVFQMERQGVRIDRSYCMRAAQYEAERARRSEEDFVRLTGRPFVPSGKLFADVFVGDKANWQYTEKGNPSFDSDVLSSFSSPAAKCVLEYRDAKAKSDFYFGFLYHADKNDRIHPNLQQDGTVTGRFSSTSPNLQNVTNEEDLDPATTEFLVRRALVPEPGFCLISIDYSAMEYRMMLERAARLLGHTTPLIEMVKGGLDVHQAAADLATAGGVPITRKQAKMVNFLTLYGGGDGTLAANLGCSVKEARLIRGAIFKAAPEIQKFISTVVGTAERRGYLFGWLGRRWHFPDRRFAYKGPNSVIQGDCADVMKIALNRIDAHLCNSRSKLILTIHDEVVIESPLEEAVKIAEDVKNIMVEAFPARYLPMAAEISFGVKSLADLVDGGTLLSYPDNLGKSLSAQIGA